tara:strand:+ start:5704 stop:6933 length:1230 start_codon:yes stop_codon:yes gene_type:complete
MQLSYLKIPKLNIFLLLAGPGLYSIQLLSRFAVPEIFYRQIIDILYFFIVLFIGLFFFRIPVKTTTKYISLFTLATLIINTISLINGYATLFHTLYVSLLLIIFPALISIITLSKSKEIYIRSFIYYFVLPLLFLNFAIAFIELYLRGATSFGSLQITGRSYELIALSILSLLLLVSSRKNSSRGIFFGYMITTLLSFSRGAIATFSIIFFSNLLKSFKKILILILIVLIMIFIFMFFGVDNDFIDRNFFNIYSFWRLRLNLEQGFAGATDFLAAYQSRQVIASQCFEGISRYPIFGVGIGSIQSFFLINYTDVAYSGCHNFFITAFLERGIIGGFIGLGLILFTGLKVLQWSLMLREFYPLILFFMFLVFITSTGSGFSIMSDSIRNPNVLITLLLIISSFRLPRRNV